MIEKPPSELGKAPRNRTIELSEKDREYLLRKVAKITGEINKKDIENKVIKGDFFKIVDFLPSNFVDLLFIDPPYNITKKFFLNKFKKLSIRDYMEWTDSWMSKMTRLLKPKSSIYICGDWRSSTALHLVAEKYFFVQNRISFEREKGRGAKSNWKNNSEDIWFCTMSKNYAFNIEAVKTRRKVIAPYRVNGSPKDWEESEKNFYIVGLYDNYVRRYEKNIVGTNPIACGYMNQNDFCQLNWLVNVTGSSGDYKIDVNFSSSYYPNVANNDTLNSYIRIKSSPSFAIKLPGQSWILSSKTKPGTLTTPIEFNATSKTDYNVVPCVYGYDCNPGYVQDSVTPIFNFTNTGNKAEKWNISLSQSLPSYIHLYGNTSSNPTLQEITTSGWIAANNIPVGGYAQAWLWANFVDALPGGLDIAINHTSMRAP